MWHLFIVYCVVILCFQRTKAEVDRAKLREIEEQDKRLAEIIQEQEKIRQRKAKHKWKQEQEAKRAQVGCLQVTLII